MIKIAHINIRGIKSKMIEIKSFIDEEDIDIMVLSETKLQEGEN